MNYYMKLIVHAAAKVTGRPAVLSPLLDSYCVWESKKSRFSTEITKYDYIMILKIEKEEDEDSKKKFEKYEGHLKNFNWSRDCTYEYAISPTIAPLVKYMALYWTGERSMVWEDFNLENPLSELSRLKNLDHFEFRLIPTEVIDDLVLALNDSTLKPILKAIKKKYKFVSMYFGAATKVPELNDVLSPLKCIPLWKKLEMEFQDMDAEAAVGQYSKEDSGAETSRADSKGPKSKSAKPKETVTTKPK